jgi:hypothetical protein
MVAGNFGSGKTEVSVNLALELAHAGVAVQVADLDLVNPYFRCREARLLMRAHGIRVVVPPDARLWADLPILMPEVRGMLHPPGNTVTILDVGGDEVGSRVLSTFRTDLADGDFQLWQVINSRRPFTGTVDGCLAMQREIETSSRLRVTGLLVNTHLIDETTAEVVIEGWRLARQLSERNGVPIRAVAVADALAAEPALIEIDVPILRLQRTMLPPWRKHQEEWNGTHCN